MGTESSPSMLIEKRPVGYHGNVIAFIMPPNRTKKRARKGTLDAKGVAISTYIFTGRTDGASFCLP
jgi:hypothetical protein